MKAQRHRCLPNKGNFIPRVSLLANPRLLSKGTNSSIVYTHKLTYTHYSNSESILLHTKFRMLSSSLGAPQTARGKAERSPASSTVQPFNRLSFETDPTCTLFQPVPGCRASDSALPQSIDHLTSFSVPMSISPCLSSPK